MKLNEYDKIKAFQEVALEGIMRDATLKDESLHIDEQAYKKVVNEMKGLIKIFCMKHIRMRLKDDLTEAIIPVSKKIEPLGLKLEISGSYETFHVKVKEIDK